MPYLSAFTPCGLLKCSSAPSYAERFYRAQVDLLGDQYRLEEGDHMEATLYARSILLGCTKRVLEHAGDQVVPALAFECLEHREEEYGSIPTPYQSLAARRAALAIRRRLPKMNTTNNVTQELREVVGEAFVAYRPTTIAEATVEPPNCGDQPMNFQPTQIERKDIVILTQISTGLGGPITVRYEPLDPDSPVAVDGGLSLLKLIVGDVVVVDPENNLSIERVTVTAVQYLGTGYTFTAVFNKAHEANTPATTAPFPYWRSTKRHNLVVLTAEGALDAETRRKANEWCARVLRGVSTWSLAGESSPGVVGPFKVGEGLIGVTTIGTITL